MVTVNGTGNAHVVRLRHVAAVEDELAECMACGTQIGVLLWQDGRSFLQECPACGAVLRAEKVDGYLIVGVAPHLRNVLKLQDADIPY